jgi:hypothetical protein
MIAFSNAYLTLILKQIFNFALQSTHNKTLQSKFNKGGLG